MGWLRYTIVPHICSLEYTFESDYAPTLGDFWQCDVCHAAWQVTYRSGNDGTVSVGYTRWQMPDYLDLESYTEYIEEAVKTYQLLHEDE